jgi:hypothetical protein
MRILAIATLTLFGAAASWAADSITPLDVKTGLWESKTTMSGLPNMRATPSIPTEQLAKLPPEQRARVEAMMKSRVGGGGMTTKVCITPESLSSGQAFSRVQNGCTRKIVSATSAKQEIHLECNQEGMKTSGDLVVERIDAGHIKGSLAMKGGQPEHPVNTKMSFENTWVSSDCGDVKPSIAK